MKEYCNVCWAKLPNGLCFCAENGNSENCQKARVRFMEQKKKAEAAKSKKDTRKETAEKFAERVKEETDHGISALYDSTVDEICKEIVEGKV